MSKYVIHIHPIWHALYEFIIHINELPTTLKKDIANIRLDKRHGQ